MSETFKKTRIFLVDDHQFVRDSLVYLLSQEHDFEICGEAGDSAKAEREILVQRPDLAVLDISLHGSSGFDLIKKLRSELPDMFVVMLSMHDEKLYAERCIRAGAHGYVMKRESSQRIVSAIRTILAGKHYVSEQMAAMFVEKFMAGHDTQNEDILAKLSDRELEVFNLIGQGLASRKIAATLGLNLKTVQVYSARIKQKLHFSTATELLREATRWHHDSSSA
jgi:DNA-binding NarL/FixJ family response regulator